MSESPLFEVPGSPPTVAAAKTAGKRAKKVTAYKDESSELSSEEDVKPASKKAKTNSGKAQTKAKAPAKKSRAAKDSEEAVDEVEAESTKPAAKKAAPKKRVPKVDPFSEEALGSHPCRCGPPASLGPNASKESKYHTSQGPTHRIGAHTSASGGIENALVNASQLGGRALALFLKNQRKWESSPLDEDGVKKFRKLMLERDMGGLDYSADYILPHGSYLINLGNPDASKRETSYRCFLDDLKRCEQLGIHLYNWHPGSTVGACTKEEALKNVAASINRAHKETEFVIPVIENMAGAGNILGATWEDLATIIEHVENKDRVGVCIDTCHMFAAGYDIRTRETYEESMSSFDRIVGLKYLKGMHINDSQGGGFNCKKDRHDNIGLGEIGMAAFLFVVQDPRLANIPLILETPTFEETEVWRREMEILYELQEVDGTEEEVEAKLKEMTESWREELKAMREKSGKGPKPKPAKNESAPKAKGKKAPAAKKGRGKKASESEEEEEE